MAAPLQTYLFENGKAMAGKHIGLIVSSASSGISGVESDAKRLIPEGDFFSKSLWIRSNQTSSCQSMIDSWLKDINYNALTGAEIAADDLDGRFTVYTLSGVLVGSDLASVDNLGRGLYVINGKITLK